ncbi:hypothetical protein [Sphingosinicella microcystinivorans]|uniref:Uncharacterized protein n=1 Tax=Sphingosinicella microcystinivorans TaxID=335406 RepID=A0AAD1D4L7_SPHMI|nr:hypothetical protein [Sphingosinicella microcystinivorans]RKS85467.1 hypothetical protein DFR51_3387 [Sphingosinicella microcystinivorans]BBE33243.1 hypothetical protein SmB9_09010 [Sphingosinicella microcystinivorans]
MTNRLASVLGGDAGAAVLPRLASLAAPVCGQPWNAFAADAGQIVQAAKRIAALFATDAIVIEIDASDSASTVEAVRRLAAEGGRPVVPILPGPVTLAATSDADAAKEVLTGIVEGIGEARPALLLFDESTVPASELAGMGARKLFNTLRNVTSYFDVPLGIIMAIPDEDAADAAVRLKPEAVIAAGTADAALLDRIAAEGPVAGIALAANDTAAASNAAALAATRPLIITTLGGGPDPLPVETMHAFMGAFSGARQP